MNFTTSGTGLQNFDKFLDTAPTYQYHTEDIGDIRKKNIEDGINERPDTPKLTTIKTRYNNNHTPTRKNIDNKNINIKNNTPNNYYSKYIRRNNSGVSINKMIDKNRINSKKIYSNIIPRKYY